MKVVSACLAGIKCRYNGSSKPCNLIIEMVKNGEAIPVCPEQLGGLPTPRSPAELKDGRFITKDGADVTENYLRGTEEAIKIALLVGCEEAILKSKSPACGVGKIYDGSFSGKLVDGDGHFTSALRKKGIKVTNCSLL